MQNDYYAIVNNITTFINGGATYSLYYTTSAIEEIPAVVVAAN